jgi:excinuclease ABC subunit B
MSEDLSDYLLEMGVKVHYLQSEINTLERTEILRDLRLGVFDVVVGINLLREGLDLPEVSLVAILDADKEGFLRSDTALIQTVGRAARHVDGKVIMYADHVTNSMERAISETNRRRDRQAEYNILNGIEPRSIVKEVQDLAGEIAEQHGALVAEEKSAYLASSELPKDELNKLIKDLEKQMKAAAQALEFEKAAVLRDQIVELRQIMVLKDAGKGNDIPEWEILRLLDKNGVKLG